MNDNIKVSIIVPIYNVEKYVSKCIDSIIKQDYKNLEIILVNDGSKDNSLSICKKYENEDERINLIDKKNGGVSSARNAGLSVSTGDYIVFVDGDDYLENDFVSYMLSNMINNDCDFALSKNCFKYNNEKQVAKDNIKIMNSVDVTALLLSMRISVGCWNKMYKREIIENIKFDENQFYGEGLQFITTVSQKSKKAFVGEKKVYNYRQDNSMSATKKYKYENFINGEKSLQLIEKNLILKDKKIYDQLYAHYCMFYCNAYSATLKNNKNKEYKDSFKYWKKMAKKNFKYIIKNNEINFLEKIKKFILLDFTVIFKIKYKIFG